MNPETATWPHIFTSSYRPTGTKSFRLASSQWMKPKGSEKGYGSNGQNRSDDERRAFRPPPGYRFIQNDLEGAEAVAVALLCREGPFRDLIRLKIKPHNFMCVQLFPEKFADYIDVPNVQSLTPRSFHALPRYKDIVKICKALKREYDLAKRTVHGANYSMGWKTFRDTVLKETQGRVLLTAAEAKRMLAMYFTLFPEVQEYQAVIEESMRLGLPVRNLFGHQVRLVQRFTTDLVRLAISWGPQSTVGQCTNLASVTILRLIRERRLKWHLHNVTHDSILLSAPAAEAVDASHELARAMTFEFESPIDGWKATIGVERQIGDNWGKYEETENPTGLKVQ